MLSMYIENQKFGGIGKLFGSLYETYGFVYNHLDLVSLSVIHPSSSYKNINEKT